MYINYLLYTSLEDFVMPSIKNEDSFSVIAVRTLFLN